MLLMIRMFYNHATSILTQVQAKVYKSTKCTDCRDLKEKLCNMHMLLDKLIEVSSKLLYDFALFSIEIGKDKANCFLLTFYSLPKE